MHGSELFGDLGRHAHLPLLMMGIHPNLIHPSKGKYLPITTFSPLTACISSLTILLNGLLISRMMANHPDTL